MRSVNPQAGKQSVSARAAGRRAQDPLLSEIEQGLCRGRFIRYGDMFDFVRHLRQVEEKLARRDAAAAAKLCRAGKVPMGGCDGSGKD